LAIEDQAGQGGSCLYFQFLVALVYNPSLCVIPDMQEM
jgi:hypothetical protein